MLSNVLLDCFRVSDNPNGLHAAFVNRQFWTGYKLFSNVLSWHGLLGDRLLADFSLTQLLNRYLLTAIGMTPNPALAVAKASRIVDALPDAWLMNGGAFRAELTRLAGHLISLGKGGRGVGPDGIRVAAAALSKLGFRAEAEAATEAAC